MSKDRSTTTSYEQDSVAASARAAGTTTAGPAASSKISPMDKTELAGQGDEEGPVFLAARPSSRCTSPDRSLARARLDVAIPRLDPAPSLAPTRAEAGTQALVWPRMIAP